MCLDIVAAYVPGMGITSILSFGSSIKSWVLDNTWDNIELSPAASGDIHLVYWNIMYSLDVK